MESCWADIEVAHNNEINKNKIFLSIALRINGLNMAAKLWHKIKAAKETHG
jgi:hypothetical protein